MDIDFLLSQSFDLVAKHFRNETLSTFEEISRDFGKNCFSISSFMTFVLVLLNTVVNIISNTNNNSDDNNNNDNNNNNNNLNMNTNTGRRRKRRQTKYDEMTKIIFQSKRYMKTILTSMTI